MAKLSTNQIKCSCSHLVKIPPNCIKFTAHFKTSQEKKIQNQDTEEPDWHPEMGLNPMSQGMGKIRSPEKNPD